MSVMLSRPFLFPGVGSLRGQDAVHPGAAVGALPLGGGAPVLHLHLLHVRHVAGRLALHTESLHGVSLVVATASS